MNLNLINLDCTQWEKSDWQDAYNEYCQHNLYGKKTKREYYDMVMANFKKITPQPLSDELRNTWTTGWRNAVVWAKKRKCNMDGELLEDVKRKKHNADALTVAERAEQVAFDTMLKVETMER